jgi:signal transduction histidine kinase
VNGPIRVLYAEDNSLDADLTKTHFADAATDFVIDIVETGKACLDRLASGSCDLLLLDHHLPDMEGLDVLTSIVRGGIQIPTVMVTGVGDETLVVKALRLGAASYVPKADNYLESLPNLLRMVVEEHRRKREQGLLSNMTRRLLYVEHNAMDVELTLRHFAENAPQFEIEVAHRCSEALARLARAPACDAVIIDLRMPDMSGLDFAREAQQRRLPLPPFIMISGKGDEATAIASLKLGAADYVTKRDGYLDQLRYAIERAIAHEELSRLSRQLRSELAERKRSESEREALEEQLRASQRMESIGRLAGGISHDFNNLLSVILCSTDYAIERTTTDDKVRDELVEVRKAAERAAGLTRQLLAFSRKQVLQPVVLNLNQVAAAIEKMLHRILGEDIEYVQVLAPDLGPVWADPGQIEQVLMNLVVNARDAMPTGGRLTLETANVTLDEEYAARHVTVEPGRYVRVSLTDTGSGMDAPTKARIFEPFFTTKEKGKGTGLGLSTVYGIVRQSGGNIWVYSEPGLGTTFKIYLPLIDAAVGAASPTKPVKTAAPHTASTGTILVVEDEESIRDICKRILGAVGYTVLTAATGSDALATCEQQAGEIHLLLTDVVMPRMGGRGLAERVTSLRPGIKVLYMSGYSDDAIAHHGTLAPGTHFIAKPFSAADLVGKVREVLG